MLHGTCRLLTQSRFKFVDVDRVPLADVRAPPQQANLSEAAPPTPAPIADAPRAPKETSKRRLLTLECTSEAADENTPPKRFKPLPLPTADVTSTPVPSSSPSGGVLAPVPSPSWSQMSEAQLRARLAHVKQVRLQAMSKRASIVCGDGLYDESPDYLKIEEHMCAARIEAIEHELQARNLPMSHSSPPPSLPSPASLSGPAPTRSASAELSRAMPAAPVTSAAPSDTLCSDDVDAECAMIPNDVIEVLDASPPRARPAPPTQPTERHPWDDQVMHSLRHIFHLTQFRPDQLEAINATLSGRDVFCLMPTGGGKSLCYQLPATVTLGTTDGITVVISPLLALIHNQVQSLLRKDIPALSITGDMSDAQRQYASAELCRPDTHVRLLYVTPEFICNSRLATRLFQHLHQTRQLARFVIDEAHCVDQWGHDFRPDYVRLDCLRREYPAVPLMALTATARIDTVEGIQKHLGMRRTLVLRQSFNRPNLTYSVRPKRRGGGTLDSMAALIQERHANDCGIIYCLSRRDCENVASDLESKYGIRARHFHAGLSTQDKLRIQEGWEANQFKVIVATIAFGMGIDKADVRFVLHHSMPKSLEGYYQETGRAGRDGKQSECVLFWSMEDSRKLESMIKDSSDASPEQKRLQLQSLAQVKAFCQSLTECRRTNILKYFGEQFDPALCHASCDNCQRTPAYSVDMTVAAKDFVKMVKLIAKPRARANFTKVHFMGVFRGSLRKDIKDKGHHLNLYHGRGASFSDEQVKRLMDHLLSQNILAEYEHRAAYQRFPNYYLQLGPRAAALLDDQISVQLDMPSSPPPMARRVAPRSPSPECDDMDLTTISLSPSAKRSSARAARPTTQPRVQIAAMPLLRSDTSRRAH